MEHIGQEPTTTVSDARLPVVKMTDPTDNHRRDHHTLRTDDCRERQDELENNNVYSNVDSHSDGS